MRKDNSIIKNYCATIIKQTEFRIIVKTAAVRLTLMKLNSLILYYNFN